MLFCLSPQWENNSKGYYALGDTDIESTHKFQSPQWGDNSKVYLIIK